MPVNLIFDPYVDAADEHRYRVVHPNGNILVTPHEGYKNLGDMMTAWNTLVVSIANGYIEYRTGEAPDGGN